MLSCQARKNLRPFPIFFLCFMSDNIPSRVILLVRIVGAPKFVGENQRGNFILFLTAELFEVESRVHYYNNLIILCLKRLKIGIDNFLQFVLFLNYIKQSFNLSLLRF